jgi:excinuclease UvrABC nuclease subunit
MRKNFGGWWVDLDRPTVYRAFGWAGELLYVGCTVSPRDRLRAHRYTPTSGGSRWWGLVHQITQTRYSTQAEAAAAERAAIREEDPIFNSVRR